jgi:hypothetical protein
MTQLFSVVSYVWILFVRISKTEAKYLLIHSRALKVTFDSLLQFKVSPDPEFIPTTYSVCSLQLPMEFSRENSQV